MFIIIRSEEEFIIKSSKKLTSTVLLATLVATSALPVYAADNNPTTVSESATIIENTSNQLLNTKGINPELPDAVIKSLLTDNVTLEDAQTLSTLRDAVLLEDSFNNVYSYKSQRFNTSTNYAIGTKINIYLVNTGNKNIRMYTTTQAGQTMESAIVRPGEGKLLTIDDNDIMYWGSQMEIGYHVLSYYIHADPATSGPISFTLRVKHYDV